MLEHKLEKLMTILQELGSVAICFSGGTDSTFLSMTASKALSNDKFLLIHVSSELIPRVETAFVNEWTEKNNFPLEIIKVDPLANKDVARNDIERCYYCKKAIMEVVFEQSKKHGLEYVLDGTNCDDLGDYRPGMKATDEKGVRHPLLEAGLNKAEIRILADLWDLPNWNTPASACLASRLPYGMELSSERLRMVDEGEEFLRQLGYQGCRVRCLEDGAKLELQADDYVSAAENAELIVKKLRKIGFKQVLLDLQGYVRGGGQVIEN